MAFWVGGGGHPLDSSGRDPYFEGGKRRVSHSEGSDYHDFNNVPKRARLEHWDDGPRPFYSYDEAVSPPFSEPIQDKHPAFLIIRECSPTPEPPNPALACAMERTQSGLSISSDTSKHSCDDEDESMLGDLDAASLVRNHVASFRRRYPDSKYERILKALINPKSREADFPLDNDALRSIFYAANELFFANRLSQRVDWDWSHPASSQYQSHIVGTTALRRSARLGGYETLIVLSSPILKDTKYNRRLLISTFLHEMIHSFLFINCGLKARECGGHTEGFRQIAEIIDNWVGKEYLRLSDMEADLERFRDDGIPDDEQGARVYPDQHHAWAADDYLSQPLPRRHHDHSQWQWAEREGFSANAAYGQGSSYVY